MTLEEYSEYLETVGIAEGLIAKGDAENIWERHILNCLDLANLIGDKPLSICDVGSGAGLPGIVLAIALPNAKVYLIEPRKHRADFMQNFIARGLPNAKVIKSKAENVQDQFDIVTARALAPLNRLIPMTKHLLNPSGRMLFIKGEKVKEELFEIDIPFTIHKLGHSTVLEIKS